MLEDGAPRLDVQRNRRALAIIAFAALNARAVTRARLAELIWDDREKEQSLASLRQALYELRALGLDQTLTIERSHVAVAPENLRTDLGELESAYAGGDTRTVADRLRAFQGTILGGLDGISESLDDWLQLERGRIHSRLVEIGATSIDAALADGDEPVALDLAQSFERIDAFDERAARGAMRAAAALGNRGEVHRRYKRLEEVLRRELGIEPSRETQSLYALLRDQPRSFASQPTSATDIAGPHPRLRTPHVLAAIACALLIACVAWWADSRAPLTPDRKSVAVLPFEDLSGGTGVYFAGGVAEEVLNLLAEQRSIGVVGRLSSQEIAAGDDRLERARELGISHLLEGSLRRDSSHLLVLVRLRQVSDGASIWSERFERRPGDVFAVQHKIAQGVAAALEGASPLHETQQTSVDVYSRYLAARSLARERREKTLLEAERLLREALERDTHFAPAHAELAQVITLLTEHSASYGNKPFEEARREAVDHARKAISIAPNLGDGYAALGLLQFDFASAKDLFARAVRLAPQRSEFHRWLGQAYSERGDRDRAIAEFKRAVDIDPLWGLNYEFLIDGLYFFGQPEQAKRYLARFDSLSSDVAARLQVKRITALYAANWAESFRIAKRLHSAHPNERTYAFRYASELAALGDIEQARRVFGRFDPFVASLLEKDDAAVVAEVRREKASYWVRRNGMWGVDDFLLSAGHGDMLVDAYLSLAKESPGGSLAGMALMSRRTPLILALRQAGRTDDANRLLTALKIEAFGAPSNHLRKAQAEMMRAFYYALSGDKDAALAALERVDDPTVLAATPARSLLNAPVFATLRGPRLEARDETLRRFINRNRLELGWKAISRQDWHAIGRF